MKKKLMLLKDPKALRLGERYTICVSAKEWILCPQLVLQPQAPLDGMLIGEARIGVENLFPERSLQSCRLDTLGELNKNMAKFPLRPGYVVVITILGPMYSRSVIPPCWIEGDAASI